MSKKARYIALMGAALAAVGLGGSALSTAGAAPRTAAKSTPASFGQGRRRGDIVIGSCSGAICGSPR